MGKYMLSASLASLGLTLVAAPQISDVSVRQDWPWDKKVRVEYSVSGADVPIDIALRAKDGDEVLSLSAAALSGEWQSVGNGRHLIVIDPALTAYADRPSFKGFCVALRPITERKYMIVDLDPALENTVAARVSFTNEVVGTKTDSMGNVMWDDAYKTTKLVLRRCPAGEFMAGSPSTQRYRRPNELYQHVRISEPFYLGVFEFTQRQAELVGSDCRSYCVNADHYAMRPVDAAQFAHVVHVGLELKDYGFHCGDSTMLGGLRKLVGGKITFHLPTEAQWEYAFHAGTGDVFYNAENPGDGSTYASIEKPIKNDGNANRLPLYTSATQVTPDEGGTKPVGSYLPNPWGFYDFIGNVAEWTRDWYALHLGGTDAADDYLTDPEGMAAQALIDPEWGNAPLRVLKGCGYSMKNQSAVLEYSCYYGRPAGRNVSRVNVRDFDTAGFRVWAPDQFSDVFDEDEALTEPMQVSIREERLYPLVLSDTRMLSWSLVPDIWGAGVELKAIELCRTTASGTETELLPIGAANADCAFGPRAEATVERLSLTYLTEDGEAYVGYTNDVVVLKSQTEAGTDVFTSTNGTRWTRFMPCSAIPVAYSPDWVAFGVTNETQTGTFVVAKDGVVAETAELPVRAGWYVFRPGVIGSASVYTLAFDYPASPLPNAFSGEARPKGGQLIILR